MTPRSSEYGAYATKALSRRTKVSVTKVQARPKLIDLRSVDQFWEKQRMSWTLEQKVMGVKISGTGGLPKDRLGRPMEPDGGQWCPCCRFLKESCHFPTLCVLKEPKESSSESLLSSSRRVPGGWPVMSTWVEFGGELMSTSSQYRRSKNAVGRENPNGIDHEDEYRDSVQARRDLSRFL